MRFFVIGSSGIISRNFKKILKRKVILFSRFEKKKTLKTNIFSKNFNIKKDNFFKIIRTDDVIILLSNLGELKNYNNHKKRSNFIKYIKNNLLNNIKRNKLIFASTDYIFEGKNKIYYDHSKPYPKNFYGKTKYKIETEIKNKIKDYIILRFPKIYSLDKKTKGFPLGCFNYNNFCDQHVSFLDERNLKFILKKILNNIVNISGSYNVPGNFFGTRYLFFKKIIKENKLRNNISPITMNKKQKKILPLRLKMRTVLFKKINFKNQKYNFNIF
jgi:dTDP-4-dehydrorhamnose reductase